MQFNRYRRSSTDGQEIFQLAPDILINADDNLVQTVRIELDINKDLKFEQTIFINDARHSTTHLSFKLNPAGMLEAEKSYIDFPDGLEETLIR